MKHLIFTAVLTAFLGIGGYQQGSEFFGPSPDGLGHDPHYDPGQLNSSQTGPWPALVSPHSKLSIELWKIQHTRKGLLLVDDHISHPYRLDWILICQPAAIHTASGTHSFGTTLLTTSHKCNGAPFGEASDMELRKKRNLAVAEI
ncbi:hypothetical protein DSO57_1029061 [Entomophthora muscae]|uniref:Uncharacterized protein n=1 Tax=Entomophthora muscae TaxID=34485 RepID=A0ACC2TZG3_9FUNG|nr:hypothetical protein DSO57_1029061 [Entomophthora muscae]